MVGLRQLAEADLVNILEDDTFGFGYSIQVTDPSGTIGLFTGFSNDISQIIDPETGQVVSGRAATVVLRISSLECEGLSLPQGIADAASKPWIVEFKDINCNDFKFKVAQSNPDRALGIVVCILELYE